MEIPTVFIDRRYDDPWLAPQPWSRLTRDPGEPEWTASTGGTVELDEQGGFATVEEAVAWGRARAELVLVRLGGDVEAVYSAGSRPATWSFDGGWPFPPWPPATWPDYRGPPEPGWPEAPDDE